MKCQQKSGVFLNIECQNTKENTCSNCEKDVCEVHSHNLENALYCEDCYWERYLLTLEYVENDNYSSTDTVIIASTSSNSSSNSTSTSNNSEGFEGGFGGGEFGGGGATGAWTEGDMQSLSDTNNTNNLMSDSDDTFFYS